MATQPLVTYAASAVLLVHAFFSKLSYTFFQISKYFKSYQHNSSIFCLKIHLVAKELLFKSESDLEHAFPFGLCYDFSFVTFLSTNSELRQNI